MEVSVIITGSYKGQNCIHALLRAGVHHDQKRHFYPPFNFTSHQSVRLSNNLLQSINILLLATGRSPLPRDHSRLLCASNREAYRSPTHTRLAWCFVWSCNSELSIPVPSTPNTLRKWDAGSFHFEESQKALFCFFSLVAEWIVHSTVRGTSWTPTAVLTPHQGGAVHSSPQRSWQQCSDTVGGGAGGIQAATN